MRQDIPIESPNKYGRMDDDLTEFADALAGRSTGDNRDRRPRTDIQAPDQIDEDFLRTLGNPGNHYGE